MSKHDRLIYAAEDPNKKLVRFMWWHRARELNPHLFYEKNHLVLAGTGGDIAILTAMGVDPAAVIAADENKECVRTCQKRFPDVQYMLGTITPKHPTGYMLFEDGSFATAMLDFCGAPAKSNTDIMQQATKLVDPRGVIGCTFLTSRGTPELKELTKKLSLADLFQYAYDEELNPGVKAAVQRAHVVGDLMRPLGWHVNVIYTYQSHQEKLTHRMVTMLLSKAHSRKVVFHTVKSSEEDIKEAILATDERPTFDAALMLNVPRMTVAGWKAHATRKQVKK